jgi:hypothetical protein
MDTKTVFADSTGYVTLPGGTSAQVHTPGMGLQPYISTPSGSIMGSTTSLGTCFSIKQDPKTDIFGNKKPF